MAKKCAACEKAKMQKMQKGGSFPDLNKDGKVTKADILKGRGVIKQKGGSSSDSYKKSEEPTVPVKSTGYKVPVKGTFIPATDSSRKAFMDKYKGIKMNSSNKKMGGSIKKK